LHGFTASLSLAGDACNVYGTDISDLTLTVEVQSAHRLHVNIEPTYVDSSNTSHYILPSELVYAPKNGRHSQEIDLEFSWSNDPSFSFVVVRKSTGDVLFDTRGSVLVYENQFIEFVSQLPENYNLYGMGERIHGLRLGNNFTATFYAADAGDPIDGNIYGNHPVYLDTRYYETNSDGERTLVNADDASADKEYESYTHGVYMRNAHGMVRNSHNRW
jgi:alpha-glucosidase